MRARRCADMPADSGFATGRSRACRANVNAHSATGASVKIRLSIRPPKRSRARPGAASSLSQLQSEAALDGDSQIARGGDIALLAAEESHETQLAVEVGLVREVAAIQGHFPVTLPGNPGHAAVQQRQRVLRADVAAARQRTAAGTQAAVVLREVDL